MKQAERASEILGAEHRCEPRRPLPRRPEMPLQANCRRGIFTAIRSNASKTPGETRIQCSSRFDTEHLLTPQANSISFMAISFSY
jgi:hypothetical protein